MTAARPYKLGSDHVEFICGNADVRVHEFRAHIFGQSGAPRARRYGSVLLRRRMSPSGPELTSRDVRHGVPPWEAA
jgi:hypothetical protein